MQKLQTHPAIIIVVYLLGGDFGSKAHSIACSLNLVFSVFAV